MNKNDLLITTGPIGIPSQNPNYGILTMILLCKVLGIKLDIPSYLIINNSANKHLESTNDFMASIQQLEATPKHTIFDRDTLPRITHDLTILANNGNIIEQKTEKLKCSCGRVDCVDRNIQYKYIKNGKCIFCNSDIRKYSENSLLLAMPTQIQFKQCVLPLDFNKKYKAICSDISGQRMLISKNRDTGLKFDQYNVDIDMATYLTLNNFNLNNKLILGTTHVLNKLVIMNEVDKMLHPESNNIFLIMSYLHGHPDIQNIKIKNARNIQLYLLNSLGKTENSTFRNDFIYGVLNKLSKSDYREQKVQYYNSPAKIDFEHFFDSFNKFYIDNFLGNQK